MNEHWNALLDAGVPIGAVRPVPMRIDAARVRTALAGIATDAGPIPPRHVEPLLAWLRGLRHAWPERWADLAGRDGDRLMDRLLSLSVDPNRYLKLRRLAIENLAGVL